MEFRAKTIYGTGLTDRRRGKMAASQGTYSGCSTCPAKEICSTDHYRGSACSALRYSAGEDKDPLTMAEELRQMEDVKLRDFLYNLGQGTTPWCNREALAGECSGTKSECLICLNGWLSSKANDKKEELNHACQV